MHNVESCFSAYRGYLAALRADGVAGGDRVATFVEWLCGVGTTVDLCELESVCAAEPDSRLVRRAVAAPVVGGGGECSIGDVVVVADSGGSVGSCGSVGEAAGAVADGAAGAGSVGACGVGSRGPNWERNRQWKEKKKGSKSRRVRSVPEWRRSASVLPSLSGSVRTVSTECAAEIEAKRTLAKRRVAENKVAEALAEHRLASLHDKDKTKALQQLAVVRVEEKINTVRAKSQASYKKCGSPLESVGSAASAGEFAWKQEVRKRDALKVERDYLEQQLVEMLKHASPEARQAVADIPEPYIPSLAEIEAEDEDISPFWSQEEMEADAARYAHG